METGSAASLPGFPLPSAVADDPKTRREGKEEGMELLRASKGTLQRYDRETWILLAEKLERRRRSGRLREPPPIALVDYPDLFERAWGWDFLLPHDMNTPLALYKIYLQQYYEHNHQREANAAAAAADDLSLDGDDHGNDLLADLVNKCINTENNLKLEWNSHAKPSTIDDDESELQLVSDNITKHAREMAQVLGSESPAAIALKCIIKEAELMRQCITSGDSVMSFSRSNAIRKCALYFMTNKDYDYVSATAAMMGIMKEAELAIDLLRGDQCKNNSQIACADRFRHRTFLIMSELCDECYAIPEPTVGKNTGDLNSNASDDKLADNGNREGRGNVSENKDEYDEKNSKEELAGNDMGGGNSTVEIKPDEELGRNSLDKEKQVDPVKGCNEETAGNDGTDKNQDLNNGKAKTSILKKLFGRDGGRKKWISGCFNLKNEERTPV